MCGHTFRGVDDDLPPTDIHAHPTLLYTQVTTVAHTHAQKGKGTHTVHILYHTKGIISTAGPDCTVMYNKYTYTPDIQIYRKTRHLRRKAEVGHRQAKKITTQSRNSHEFLKTERYSIAVVVTQRDPSCNRVPTRVPVRESNQKHNRNRTEVRSDSRTENKKSRTETVRKLKTEHQDRTGTESENRTETRTGIRTKNRIERPNKTGRPNTDREKLTGRFSTKQSIELRTFLKTSMFLVRMAR